MLCTYNTYYRTFENNCILHGLMFLSFNQQTTRYFARRKHLLRSIYTSFEFTQWLLQINPVIAGTNNTNHKSAKPIKESNCRKPSNDQAYSEKKVKETY